MEKYAQNKQMLKTLFLNYPIKYSKNILTKCVKRISTEDEMKITQIMNSQTFKKVVEQEIKIPFKHQSLILLGGDADDAIIDLLEKKLSANKMRDCVFVKAYINYRS